MKNMRLIFSLLIVGLAVCQFSPSANQYPVEAAANGPIKQEIVFTAEAVPPPLPSASIIIGVVSAPHHTEERDAVRSSWVQLQSLTDPKLNHLTLEQKQQIVIRFIIGEAHDQTTEELISGESLKYHDIVRVPVYEDYFNLTLKTGEFMKWAVSSYNFNWIFKCDDDSFVRIDKLLETLMEAGTNSVYLGKIWTGTPIDSRVDKYTPWSKYARFAAGAGYALSHDLAEYIVRNYDHLHKWPMEDVAVGMWISPLKVNYIDHPHFHSLPEGCDRDMIVQNPANPKVMRETFFHTTNGVPCHATPDPFDPSTKNVPDHVLIEYGIAKSDETRTSISDAMKPRLSRSAETQSLIQMDGKGDVDEEMQIEDEKEMHFLSNQDGMSENEMNANHPSQNVMNDMNSAGITEVSERLDSASLAAADRMNM
eukprot:c13130_g1_i1.p1 GENE.c13130_g1_i1~~c13130_g1_i1.p1  ORF type:complete len:437 (-),score=172.45 c13130_g1_i1:94-1362(-)